MKIKSPIIKLEPYYFTHSMLGVWNLKYAMYSTSVIMWAWFLSIKWKWIVSSIQLPISKQNDSKSVVWYHFHQCQVSSQSKSPFCYFPEVQINEGNGMDS